MTIADFSKKLEALEQTSGRNDMTTALFDLYKELNGDEIKVVMYFLIGRLAPKFEDIEFNFSRKLIIKGLVQAIGDEKVVNDAYKRFGDVGLAAENLKDNYTFQTSDLGAFDTLIETDNSLNNLSILDVFKRLSEISDLEGKGSQDGKINKYIELAKNLDSLSLRYVSRIIVGDLRLGISEKTLLDSLSWYLKGDKSLRKLLDKAFGFRADIGEIAKIVIESNDPETDLGNIEIEPGTPIASKLVERESNSEKVWERMPECFVQPKLDGLRGQLHFSNKTGEIFSRNMENMTENFPDLVEALKNLNVDSVILDSEIIGYDNEKDEYLSYQETMTRRRKYEVEEFVKNVPVRAMCFDILYLNGEDYSRRKIEERIKKLEEVLKNSESLKMLETIQMKSEVELEDYFSEKVLSGLEGIITKEKESIYEPGTRNYTWIKLKANTRSDLVDTIDVVVLGYYNGRGQRAKFGLGALLTGVYDPEKDEYYSIGKVGTGITDEMFKKIKDDTQKYELSEKPGNYIVDSTLVPDTWLEPKIVIEIDADEVTRSPNHTAARGIKADVTKDDSEKGLSVRFPRLKIWDRDKDYPNTVGELVRLYELRKNKK